MKILMSKFILAKIDMFKKMTKMITMTIKNIDRLSMRVNPITMNIIGNHSMIIIIPKNRNTQTMSRNKIGVDNRDIQTKEIIKINIIKTEGKGKAVATEVRDMEEDKEDIREVDMKEESILEGEDTEAMIHQLIQINIIIQYL